MTDALKGKGEMNADVNWICPECGMDNVDDYLLTAAPSCAHCEFQSEMWDDVLTKEEIEAANAIIKHD